MKTTFLSAARAVLLAVTILVSGNVFTQTAGHLLFTAHLSGDEEIPAVTTNGQGLITVLFSEDRTKMFVQGAITGLSGPVTAAHFHAGGFGATGSVVVDLGPIRTGNRIAGEVVVPAGFLENALAFGIYANVHTAMHPTGEIRGQLLPESDLNFGAIMSGLNEVPPVLTTAFGLGGCNITLGHDRIRYRMLVKGLSGPIIAAHIHKGDVGVAGPVVRGLSFAGNTLIGDIHLDSLPIDFLLSLFAGEYYVNVHTAANPDGEIRGQLLFNGFLNGFALMNGDQETPPVSTSAFGIGSFIPSAVLDSALYIVLVDGLSGPAIAAHVHKAPAGTSGGVVFGLTAIPVIPGLYTATVPISSATLTDMINGQLYFNVHTAANPTGEIRGQIQTNLRKAYAFDLCAGQETSPNNSTAYGAGMVSIDQDNLSLKYQLQVDGLTGPATAAHIHNGNAGVSGGVRFALGTPAPFSEGAIAITGIDAVLIEDEGTYMNVHTVANPGGEIRGQIRRGVLCSPASAVFDAVVSDLKVFPNPVADGLTVRFDSREAFNGQLRLTDISGRVLLNQTADASGSGLQEWYLPMEHLAPGLYYLNLERSGANVFVQTVVKM